MSEDRYTIAPGLHLKRVAVDGRCQACGASDLRKYPVNTEGGWFEVVKCQACLASQSREALPRLGAIVMLSDSL